MLHFTLVHFDDLLKYGIPFNLCTQEEVLERAKRAKEQAAREALEAQGLIPKCSSLSTSMGSGGTANNGAAANVSPSTANIGVSTTASSYNPANPAAANTDPGLDTKME